MAIECTLSHILEMAIQKEIESRRFYSELSRKVTDDAAKGVLRQLSQQEQRHQKVLEQYRPGDLKSGTLNEAHTIDYKIAERFDQPRISPDMELKDVFLAAANREKHSHELYLALAELHPAGQARELLEELASQELEHKHKMEDLYTQVAFPQTDGG
jgi:rubrerythrin